MPVYDDFLTWTAWLPALATCFANVLAIIGLRSGDMSRRRRILLSLLVSGDFAVSIATFYMGALQAGDARRQDEHAAKLEGKVDTIRNVLGEAPAVPSDAYWTQSSPSLISLTSCHRRRWRGSPTKLPTSGKSFRTG